MAEPQSRTVAAGDLDVHYLELGSGIPMLLLHGGFATANISWDIPFATLSERWRLVAPDTRAHGRTTNPAGYLTFSQLADDVAALTDALRLERPVIVGFSDGGQTALEVALHHRGLARALVVCGAASQASPALLDTVHQFGFSTPGEYDPGAVRAAFGEYLRDPRPDPWGGWPEGSRPPAQAAVLAVAGSSRLQRGATRNHHRSRADHRWRSGRAGKSRRASSSLSNHSGLGAWHRARIVPRRN